MAHCLHLCVIWPGPGVVAALQHHAEKAPSLGPFPPDITGGKHKARELNLALHLVSTQQQCRAPCP